jgi:hypothetical protein
MKAYFKQLLEQLSKLNKIKRKKIQSKGAKASVSNQVLQVCFPNSRQLLNRVWQS